MATGLRTMVGHLIVALLLAWAGMAAAQARTVLDLDVARQPVALGDWGDTWMEEGAYRGPDQVARDDSIVWEPTRTGAIYPLTTGKALWIRFTLPAAPDAERWYLEVPYSSVNLVTLYSQDDTGRWQAQSAGDTLAVAAWPVPHRHPLLPVAVSAWRPTHYLARVENPHNFSAPLAFVSESYLSHSEQATSLILGIYFGIAALASILAILGTVTLRDSAYGWYTVSVILMGLTQASLTGIAGLHLWPRSPWWNDVSALALPVLAVGTLPFFCSTLVSLPQRSRRLYRALISLGLLAPVVALIIMFGEPARRIQWMVPYIAITSSASIGVVIWSARRGDRFAPWLLAGATPVLIGAMMPLARLGGLIPLSFWTTHAMQVGIAFELPILLFILTLRSQQRREHSRRIQGLDRIDPATGLLNAAVFDERLVRLMGRSKRLKYQSAVLLIDIINLDQIRQEFDQQSAEEMPLRVAGRLLSGAREIDSVARLADHRFGVLVEGPITAQEAASTGPRLVARCLMPFRNKPLNWMPQVRVAQALVPQDGGEPRDIVERLEALLAAIPADDKRAVFPLGKGSQPAPA